MLSSFFRKWKPTKQTDLPISILFKNLTKESYLLLIHKILIIPIRLEIWTNQMLKVEEAVWTVLTVESQIRASMALQTQTACDLIQVLPDSFHPHLNRFIKNQFMVSLILVSNKIGTYQVRLINIHTIIQTMFHKSRITIMIWAINQLQFIQTKGNLIRLMIQETFIFNPTKISVNQWDLKALSLLMILLDSEKTLSINKTSVKIQILLSMKLHNNTKIISVLIKNHLKNHNKQTTSLKHQIIIRKIRKIKTLTKKVTSIIHNNLTITDLINRNLSLPK